MATEMNMSKQMGMPNPSTLEINTQKSVSENRLQWSECQLP